MTRIELYQAAQVIDIPGKGEAREVFARHAFDGTIGRRIRMTGDGGRDLGPCTVLDARVDEDGGGVTLVLDWDTPPAPDLADRDPMSFAFKIPEPEDLPHDPLAPQPPRIRRAHDD